MKKKTRIWRRMKRGLRPELIVLFMVVVICYAALQVQIAMSDRQADSVRQDLGETGRVLAKENQDLKRTLVTIDGKLCETDARVLNIQHVAEDKTHDVVENVELTRRELEEKLEAFHSALSENVASTKSAMTEISGIRKSLCRDNELLVVETLYPSVKVAGSGGVGAGTVVYSEKDSDGTCHSYVLSAFHVVAGFVSVKDGVEKREPVTISLYKPDLQSMTDEIADIVVYDKARDIALLKMRERGKCFPAAKLATRDDLKEVRVFTPVYAVGCPLGHSPLPSAGEITTLNKEVDGEKYWMMDAPTIYGNSGGGVFLVDGRRFIGVSAMLCVYQQFINVPVTHMGVMVPATTVYDWLDAERFQFIYNPSYTMDICAWARIRLILSRLMGRAARIVLDMPVVPAMRE